MEVGADSAIYIGMVVEVRPAREPQGEREGEREEFVKNNIGHQQRVNFVCTYWELESAQCLCPP